MSRNEFAEQVGQRNAYKCERCQYILTTINRADGVTPFMLRCRNPNNPDGCPGMMRSYCYRLPANAPEPTWEWYAPSKGQRKRLDSGMRDHVERGGLLFRQIAHAPSGS